MSGASSSFRWESEGASESWGVEHCFCSYAEYRCPARASTPCAPWPVRSYSLRLRHWPTVRAFWPCSWRGSSSAMSVPPTSERSSASIPVSYTHLRAHETDSYLVCRLLLEKKKHNLAQLTDYHLSDNT